MDKIIIASMEAIPELNLRNAESCPADISSEPAGCPSDVSCGDDC